MSFRSWRPLLAVVLIVLQVAPGYAQLSSAASKIKQQVAVLPIGGELTVNMLDGKEYYGNLKSIEAESFSIREVDLKTDLTFRYDEVKKVRKDYGRRGFSGRRIHPHKRLIVGLIFVGALLTLVIVAVAADKS